MSDALFYPLGIVVLFLAYRQLCVFRYELAKRRARFGPFRGVRIVYSRRGAPRRSTSGHLRLVATPRKVSG